MSLLTDHINPGTIYFRDKTYPPDTVLQKINAVADYLNKKSLSNSPFVYLFAPNHIKMVYALFGIIKSGRICVLVDPAIGRLELAEMMRDTIPGVLIRIDKTTDTFDFEKEFEFKDCTLEEKRLEGLEDVCLILYTNASDGFAKGAMLTNESLRANANAIIKGKGVTRESVSCSPIAFHHLFALQTSVITPFLTGGSIVLSEIMALGHIRFLADDLEKYSVTHFYSVPIVYYLLAKMPDLEKQVKNVRIFVSGGYKLTRSIYERFCKKSGKDILEGYGLTETSLAITWHKPGEPIRIDSVGKTFPCCEVKIFSDQGREMPINQTGEIYVKGPTVMKGYYQNKEITNKIIMNGWFHTGDLGYVDADGYVYLNGNNKRMLNIGGNKVYMAEVERLMKMHKNVLSVNVSGETVPIQTNILKAKVKLNQNTPEAKKELRKWCVENMTEYKVVKEMEFEPLI